jgi:PEGA domain
MAVIVVVSFMSQGCATLLKGTTEEVMVSSDPAGAKVRINEQYNGTTPFVATVPSSQDLRIHIAKAGYKPVDITDDANFRWGYEIWSFVEFVIPLGIDLADGAAWGHSQTMVATHLEPLPTTGAPAEAPHLGSSQLPPAPQAALSAR